MEKIVNLQIEKLPEGVYLATSDNLQGLVVQGNSITETVEIARDVAKKLPLTRICNSFHTKNNAPIKSRSEQNFKSVIFEGFKILRSQIVTSSWGVQQQAVGVSNSRQSGRPTVGSRGVQQ